MVHKVKLAGPISQIYGNNEKIKIKKEHITRNCELTCLDELISKINYFLTQ